VLDNTKSRQAIAPAALQIRLICIMSCSPPEGAKVRRPVLIECARGLYAHAIASVPPKINRVIGYYNTSPGSRLPAGCFSLTMTHVPPKRGISRPAGGRLFRSPG
jgi:hypothetical protein